MPALLAKVFRTIPASSRFNADTKYRVFSVPPLTLAEVSEFSGCSPYVSAS